MAPLKPLLTYDEASRLLGVPVNTLYAWVSQKRIPHVRLSGRMVRFDPEELALWIEARRVSQKT
ncbi:MAG: helix-turn-helix domain-containing protein [Myxococcota bacterium]